MTEFETALGHNDPHYIRFSGECPLDPEMGSLLGDILGLALEHGTEDLIKNINRGVFNVEGVAWGFLICKSVTTGFSFRPVYEPILSDLSSHHEGRPICKNVTLLAIRPSIRSMFDEDSWWEVSEKTKRISWLLLRYKGNRLFFRYEALAPYIEKYKHQYQMLSM